jgi:glycosyltransferase involved in cell wall biosynthesis
MNILLISRCPPWPLYLGDRLIVYHLARELAARGHTLDLLAFTNQFEDIADRAHYADYFRHIELFPEPPRSQFSYFWRLLNPRAHFPRTGGQSWSPEMWQAIEQRLAAERYDVAHLFGGVQVYEYAYAVAALPALITPYESYSLYLRRMLSPSPPAPLPRKRGEGSHSERQFFIPKRSKLVSQADTGKPFSSTNVEKEIKDLLPMRPPLPGKLRLHGEGMGVRVLSRVRSSLNYRAARAYERFMFAPYRRTVVVSEADRDELRAINPALPIDVIPNGVDLGTFTPDNKEVREPYTLLFTGNYEYAPNVDAALRLAREVLPAVQARIPAARLWLVGNAPPPELQALASEAITVTGRVPDVRPYLARASVFVSALRLGAGIKNKVLEALAMGCPVIATPLSVDGIAARDGQEVVIAELDALPEAIIRLLNDAPLWQRLSSNGRTLIETRYSWARVAEMYEKLYQAVSNQPSAFSN